MESLLLMFYYMECIKYFSKQLKIFHTHPVSVTLIQVKNNHYYHLIKGKTKSNDIFKVLTLDQGE